MGKLNQRFIFGLVATLIGVAVLCSLGFWQLQRLQWKETLLARIEAEQAIEPRARPLNDILDADHNLARGYLRGQWIRDQTVLVGPKMVDGAWGYWNITPFALEDGRIILINRGWGEAEIKTPRRDVMVMGSLRESDAGGKPTAGNIREWHKLDVQGIAEALKLDVVPVTMFMEVSEPLDMARPAPVAASLRNEHKNYAIFWFSMALVLVVIFAIASLRGKRSASSQGPSDL